MKKLNKKPNGRHLPKALALSVSAVMASMVATTVSHGSDIEVYQNAKSGDVTLMFLIDISGSMMSDHSNSNFGRPACELPTNQAMTPRSAVQTPIAGGPSYTRKWCEVASGSRAGNHLDRMTRVKDGMIELLHGNSARNITRLADDKIIGLSTLGAMNGGSDRGAVLVPARPLSEMVNGKTQRQILIDQVIALNPGTSTPTARSYAETIAYLMGQGTSSQTRNGGGGWQYSNSSTKAGNVYAAPSSLNQAEDIKQCSGQGIYVLTDGVPNVSNPTSGLAQQALGRTFSCTNSDAGWDCTEKMNLALLDPTKNVKNLKFKTAVVGFGSDFNDVSSYDPSLTKDENLALIGNGTSDVVRAARWGVNGEGGWYSGNSSQDVVDSVNAFIDNLSNEIPSVTTGAPAIPVDRLNPASLQKYAYYQNLQPTPNLTHQSWLGNLKKFSISSDGELKGQNNADVIDNQGRLITPIYDANGNITSAVYDLWAADVATDLINSDENTVGSRKFSAHGGVWSQLLLGEDTTVADSAARKILTNRKGSESGTSATFGNSSSLQRVNLDYITDALTKNDPHRGHLVALLGYNIDVNSIPTTTADLKQKSKLRQVGAAMHSTPVLITTEGKITYDPDTKQMVSTDRQDYTLFGTTQGLLHVVNAEDGKEKFAFVPNEMVENQRDAFLDSTLTTGGLNSLYYGVDGAWTVYSEYVINAAGKLTVGNGKSLKQKGKLDVYGGLRMGGRSYYALDLRDIDTPSLKFHINPANKTVYAGSTSKTFEPLKYMGQSWSKPSITWINWGGTRKRVMFVGGGYDAEGYNSDKTTGTAPTQNKANKYRGYEYDNYDQTTAVVDVVKDGQVTTESVTATGAGVYMFDADNGDLLWWASNNVASTTDATTNSGVIGTKDANLKYSVVSEIRTVDRNGDDLVDHIYFGDLGGQIFRVDFDNTKSTIGAVPKAPTRLLNLNKTNGKSSRFYDMPAFSLYNHNGTNFGVVSTGSGNRSTPLKYYETTDTSVDFDAIYNIYDKDVTRRDLFTNTTRTTKNLGLNDLGEITNASRVSNENLIAPYTTKQGWFYRYTNCRTNSINSATTNIRCMDYKKQSEKVFGTPLAMNFKLYVSTFDSSKPGMSGDCGAGVKGESYASTFCMPYGQCEATGGPDDPIDPPEDEPLGYGIQTIVTGPKEPPPPTEDEDEDDKGGDFNKLSYCVDNDGRSAFSSIGAFGEATKTQVCLIPQRWYEQLGKI